MPATADGAPAPELPEPPSPSVTFVGRPERAERLRPGDAVDDQPARGLEPPHRGAGDRAVLAVGGDAERALERHRDRAGAPAAGRAAAAEPSAARVSGPITPSTASPRAAWKRWTAAW